MERKNFSVTFINYSGNQQFKESGNHLATTDQELIDWFVDCKCSTSWNKASDITIQEDLPNEKSIDRTDLVTEIIEKITLKKNQ